MIKRREVINHSVSGMTKHLQPFLDTIFPIRFCLCCRWMKSYDEAVKDIWSAAIETLTNIEVINQILSVFLYKIIILHNTNCHSQYNQQMSCQKFNGKHSSLFYVLVKIYKKIYTIWISKIWIPAAFQTLLILHIRCSSNAWICTD